MTFTILIIVLAVLLLFAAFLMIRTTLYANRAAAALSLKLDAPEQAPLKLEEKKAAFHLAEVIQVETISHEDPAEDNKENFLLLHQKLEKMFPRVHTTMTRETIDLYSLLYTWQGKNPDLDPVLFTSHLDVVPADPVTLDQWTYPPFSGKIADGFIWGRGSMDIKSQVIAILEACEALLQNGYQPERTVILAFGHDEEVFGTGARSIVAHLQEKGIHLEAVVDEGGSLYDGVIPGVSGIAATIGVAEKGFLSLKFTVDVEGGHSSTPGKDSAITILMRALQRLDEHRFPVHLEAVLPMFEGLAPATSTSMQFAFANLWLLGGVIKKKLTSNTETDAAIRTTTAITIIHSGLKDNILPGHAEAVVNFRLLPADTIAETCDKVRKIINDERVVFEPLPGKAHEASPISPTDTPAYLHLSSTISHIFDGAVVAPYLMLGGTDARNYYAICDQVYRFTPYIVKPEDLKRVHGLNERLSVEAMNKMVAFFYELVNRWSAE